MAFSRKKVGFLGGVFLAVLPVACWILLPDALWERITQAISTDERLVEAYAFMLAAIVELPAIWLMKRGTERPPRWLAICSWIIGIFAGLAIIVFFFAAAATAMQGW